MTDERLRPYAAVIMMLIKDDSILLLRRANTDWANGMFAPPSGHIEEGESVIDAAIRETQEEIGVTVKREDVSFAHVLYRRNNDNGRTYADFYLKATSWTGEPDLMEPDKSDLVQWFKVSELPENTISFVKDVITAHLNNEHFSELGF